jgi:hypothetical protein
MTFITLGACATSMQFGKEPMIDRLGQLTIDKSTTAQIETVLGEPQGRGEVSSPSFGTKEAWLYEVTKADGATARMQMLMVFIDNERRVYHGHLWFASGSLYSQTD